MRKEKNWWVKTWTHTMQIRSKTVNILTRGLKLMWEYCGKRVFPILVLDFGELDELD